MKNPITVDPDIQFGTPVFTGSRAPVESLFWHLESGISLDSFLDDFPSVTREQAVAVLDLAGKVFSSHNYYPYCMKLLIGENLPKILNQHFPEHGVFTVLDMGWQSKKNGELLALVMTAGFEVLITFDKNLRHQQHFARYPIAVLVLICLRKRISIFRAADSSYPQSPERNPATGSNSH